MTFFLKKYIYYQKGDGYRDEAGDWKESTLAESEFLGSIQPLSAEEVSLIPAGRESIGSIKIFTDAHFNVAQGDTAGDVIVFDGRKYVVIQRLLYGAGLVSHKKYIAALES